MQTARAGDVLRSHFGRRAIPIQLEAVDGAAEGGRVQIGSARLDAHAAPRPPPRERPVRADGAVRVELPAPDAVVHGAAEKLARDRVEADLVRAHQARLAELIDLRCCRAAIGQREARDRARLEAVAGAVADEQIGRRAERHADRIVHLPVGDARKRHERTPRTRQRPARHALPLVGRDAERRRLGRHNLEGLRQSARRHQQARGKSRPRTNALHNPLLCARNKIRAVRSPVYHPPRRFQKKDRARSRGSTPGPINQARSFPPASTDTPARHNFRRR